MSERFLGLDPGERRIGIALSDPTGTIATPVGFIDRRSGDEDEQIRAVCAEHSISIIVVGLPISLDGSEGSAAERARSFGTTVADATACTVVFQDERFTTVTADRALIEGRVRRKKRTAKRDQVAAAVMLQGFLDQRRYERGEQLPTTDIEP